MTTNFTTFGRTAMGLACAALLGLSIVTGASAAPTSYTLMCRGGGAMDSGIVSQNGRITVGVHFAKAPRAGTVQPPAPGTCTWVDRRIRPGEPRRFYLRVQGNLSVRCSAGGCRVSMAPAGVRTILEAIRQRRLFQVRVYNQRNGWFKVTRIGP